MSTSPTARTLVWLAGLFVLVSATRAWAGDTPTALFPMPENQDWESVVLHHVPPATPDPQRSWNVVKRKGCHIIIDASGRVVFTPSWTDGRTTSHVFLASRAPKSVAVCLEGDLEKESPTPEQIKAAAGVLTVLTDKLDISLHNVLTHREVDGRTTTCPGVHLDKLELLRQAGLLEGRTVSLRVRKKERRIEVLAGGEEVLAFDVTSGPREGGMQSLPTGPHEICSKDEGTAFHRYLALCAPGRDDTQMAIHGGGDAMHFDWTLRCLALKDRDMDVLFDALPLHTVVDVEE